MPMTAKTMRKQLQLVKSLTRNCSIKTLRRGQNAMGELMEMRYRKSVVVKRHRFEHFEGAWISPRDERRRGVLLYLHGGGYVCGEMEHALGFGSMMAVQNGVRVFCAAYRLAPEHPFPAAIDDVYEAYQYLLKKGYDASSIALCGESAGGGLCYALCLRLKEEGLPLPCGVIGISPWTDLTMSGESYEQNVDVDPSMTRAMLEFYADHYTTERLNPLCSPMFGDLRGMPPTLIFVGKDEIMLSDAQNFHNRLCEADVKSRLIVKDDRWHAYLLYGLEEDQGDFATIDRFLNRVLSRENKLRWLRLDNAAKLYPAAKNHHWSNVFRLSATLSEPIDKAIMQSALDVTARRFPSMAVRLRKGMFWYYLQQLAKAPRVLDDYCYPLTRMNGSEMRECALRVLVYENRVAVEFFHSLTDGNGGIIFLKTLVAEYLSQRYGVSVPAQYGVLGRLDEPTEAELEDSFLKYAGTDEAPRKESVAWKMKGTPEPGGFLNVTCFKIPVAAMLEKSHEYGVSMTAFLTAAMMSALQTYQKRCVPDREHRKPLKILIPVDLRRLYDSQTLRNFAMYTTPEIRPRLGDYDFKEICRIVHHHMGTDITKKQMAMKMATNVNTERSKAIRIVPLFIKNVVMKAVFNAVGECQSCFTLSNLGAVKVPEEMKPYVNRFDFILGVQSTAPYNCGVLSYGDTVYINIIRGVCESDFEYHLFCVLRDLGLEVEVESNRPSEKE